jgi:transcriptional regulator with XRE-family HTH domain
LTENTWKAQVEALGEVIRTQRKLAKLSLRELAQLSDLSNAYLSQLERGLHEPSIRVVKSIAAAFDLPAEVLLERAGLLNEEDAGDAPEPDRIETAILADRRLTDTQKQALLGVYRSFDVPQSS